MRTVRVYSLRIHINYPSGQDARIYTIWKVGHGSQTNVDNPDNSGQRFLTVLYERRRNACISHAYRRKSVTRTSMRPEHGQLQIRVHIRLVPGL